jgi:hypothetical protein
MAASAPQSPDGNPQGYFFSISVVVPIPEPCTGVLTYPNSTDYRPDVDGLSPVQVGEFSAFIEHCHLIDMTGSGHGRHCGYQLNGI